MRRVRVVEDLYDDKDGTPVDAVETFTITAPGLAVELDLGAANAARFRDEWISCGHAPTQRQTGHNGTGAMTVVKRRRDGEKTTALAPTLSESRALGRRITDWLAVEHAAGRHTDLTNQTPGGGTWYSIGLRRAYFECHPADAAKYANWTENEGGAGEVPSAKL